MITPSIPRFAATALGLAFLCAPVHAIIYSQPFDQTSEGFANDDPISEVGWAMVNQGDEGVRLSGQNGADGTAGYAYQFGTNKTSLAWAEETELGGAISQSSVTGFSAFIGNTDSNETRFAIEIENEGWFVTTESWTNAIGGASDFQNDALKIEFGFTTDGSAWRTLNPDPNDGSFVFSGDQSANALGSSLPAGDIIAAGVYMDNPSGGNRFDDFTVVPEPSTYVALLGLAALGFVFFRRCRK